MGKMRESHSIKEKLSLKHGHTKDVTPQKKKNNFPSELEWLRFTEYLVSLTVGCHGENLIFKKKSALPDFLKKNRNEVDGSSHLS